MRIAQMYISAPFVGPIRVRQMSFWVVVPQYTLRKAQGGELVPFFHVDVGCQSLTGAKTKRTVLRRYSHFHELARELSAELGDEKQLPRLPPKRSLARVNEDAALLSARRVALEQWLWQCLSDVEVAHSTALTSFLELAQARRGLQASSSSILATAASPERPVSEPPSPSPGVMRSPSRVQSEVSVSESDDASGGAHPAEVTPASPASPPTRLALNEGDRTSHRRMLSALQQRYATAKSDLADALQCVRSDSAIKRFLASRVDELEAQLAEAGGGGAPSAAGPPSTSSEERAMDLAWRLEEASAQLRQMEASLAQERQARVASERRAEQAEADALAARSAPVVAPQQPQEDANEASERAALERKVLAREVKSLRKDLATANSARDSAHDALAETERLAAQRGAKQAAGAVNTRLGGCLKEARALRHRMADATVERLSTEEGAAAAADPLEMLAISDSRLALLLAEAQLLGRGDQTVDEATSDVELAIREALAELVTDNASLRMKNNSLLRAVLGMAQKPSGDRVHSQESPNRPRGVWPFQQR
jgi:hypothetical protein